jgi:2-dehydropantoate 2-reductase
MTKPRILIEGVGGIGGVVAARLVQARYHPVLVTSNPEITEAIKTQGLRVADGKESFSQQAEVYTRLDELPPDSHFDVALLLMKANSVTEVARATLPHLDPRGYLVTCQNGIVEDAVCEAVGAGRVVSAIIGWGGTMHAPGVYEKTGPGAIHIGELDGHLSDRVKLLAGALGRISPVSISENIRGALWSKLAINCVITTLGALTGEMLGTMLRDWRVRRVFLRVYREVIDTAEALGIKLERIAVNPRLLYLPAGAGPVRRRLKDLLVKVIGRRYGRLRSSMLQSLERGRPTEIDFLNGYVVGQAAHASMAVPLNAALVRMIKEIEAGQRPLQMRNIDEMIDAGD